MDLVWHRNVKLWPAYVPRSREVDLPDGLLSEPIVGCGQEMFECRQSLPVTSGTVVCTSHAGGQLFIWPHRDLRGIGAAR